MRTEAELRELLEFHRSAREGLIVAGGRPQDVLAIDRLGVAIRVLEWALGERGDKS